MRRRAAKTLYRYDKNQLTAKLEQLGVSTGDSLMVHSGFDHFTGFDGTPEDVIAVLQRVLGPEGNLLMMSMPYGGSSQRYAASHSCFDVRKTPSALGLISENFRRREDVFRSANPLHPILAKGPLAKWFTVDHELLPYSCGRRSPFARFLKMGGKFLFFDAVFRSLTFVHYLEDKYRNDLPVALYDDEPAILSVRLDSGEEREIKQYLFSADARERRDFAAIEHSMLATGRLKEDKIGNTQLLFCNAADVEKTADELMTKGTGFYR